MIYAEVYAQPCLPRIVKISNSYPESTIPNARVTITTNVDLECPSQGYNVIVDIMPTGYTRIISTASGPVAVNEVTTPTDLGPWSLDVVVKLVDYPLGRILNYSKDTIVIQIASSNATSTLTSASNLIELTTALSLRILTTISVYASTSTSALATVRITDTDQAQSYADYGQSYMILGGLGATIVIGLIVVLVMMRWRGRATPPPPT